MTICFLVNAIGPLPIARADDFRLPPPGVMVHLSPAFDPPVLKGMKVHPENPFRFDFILDKGGSQFSNEQLKSESTKLIKYFLASLTIPEKDLWVNLSPYEKDRIIPQGFGLTEMGRDLLAEDYMLKQISASLIYPEGEVGKRFWQRIYKQAAEEFHTTDIPVNTFNKVWIVPDKAVVYENAQAATAYVVNSRLKVMLEQDYLSLEKHVGTVGPSKAKETNKLGSQIVREVVIPELAKEVNQDKNFGHLRQIYNSLILAAWYKKKIKDSLLTQVYEDKDKIAGVNVDDPREKEEIYQQYLRAFKKGVYNYIKEEIDPATRQEVPRKYFSGGFGFIGIDKTLAETDRAQLGKTDDLLVVTSQLGLAQSPFKNEAMVFSKIPAVHIVDAGHGKQAGDHGMISMGSSQKLPNVDLQNDMVVSPTGFNAVFINGQTNLDDFKRKFQLKRFAKEDDRDQFEIKDIIFHRKRHNGQIVYVTNLSNKAKIASTMGWELKSILPQVDFNHDLVISQPGFDRVFIHGQSKVNAFKKLFGLKEEAKKDSRNYFESRGLFFGRKELNYRVVYVTDLRNREKIAAILNLKEKPDLPEVNPENDLIISIKGLKNVFADSGTQLNLLKAHFGLLKDPQDDSRDHFNSKGIIFERKMRKSRIVYVTSLKNMHRIAEVINMTIIANLPTVDERHDFVVGPARFNSMFLNGPNKLDDFKRLFGLETLAKDDPRNRFESNGVIFERKRSGPNIVYTTSINSIGLLIKTMPQLYVKNLDNIYPEEHYQLRAMGRFGYANLYDGFRFDSVLERNTYIVLKAVGLLGELVRGVNFQVPVYWNGGGATRSSMRLDFIVGNYIFEPHWSNKETEENYYTSRRARINGSAYGNRELVVFDDIRRLYAFLGVSKEQRKEINKTVKNADSNTVWLGRGVLEAEQNQWRQKNAAMLGFFQRLKKRFLELIGKSVAGPQAAIPQVKKPKTPTEELRAFREKKRRERVPTSPPQPSHIRDITTAPLSPMSRSPEQQSLYELFLTSSENQLADEVELSRDLKTFLDKYMELFNIRKDELLAALDKMVELWGYGGFQEFYTREKGSMVSEEVKEEKKIELIEPFIIHHPVSGERLIVMITKGNKAIDRRELYRGGNFLKMVKEKLENYFSNPEVFKKVSILHDDLKGIYDIQVGDHQILVRYYQAKEGQVGVLAIIAYLSQQNVHASGDTSHYRKALKDHLAKFAINGVYGDFMPDLFRAVYTTTRPDKAMQTIVPGNKGGIDLTSGTAPLQIQSPGQAIKFHLDPALLRQLQDAPGFTPVMISIQPANIRAFLGLTDNLPAAHGIGSS